MIRLSYWIGGLKGWRRGALGLAAGACAALSMPPIGLWPSLFVAFPLFLLLVQSADGKRWWSGFGTGWIFGFGYFAVAFHWIGFAFLVDAATYLWMMPFMLGALAGGMAIYWGLAALIVKLMRLRGLSLVLGMSASMGIAEWLRGHLFTGFPWAAPGLAVDGMGGVAQLAALCGMTGLTVLVVLWAGLPFVFLQLKRGAPWIVASLLLALLPAAWGAGEMRLSGGDDPVVPGVAIRIVQPNIGQEEKWREENSRGIFDQLKQLSTAPTAKRPNGIGDVTHLIWPESAVPFLIDETPVAINELKPMLGGRTVLITGSIRRDPEAMPQRRVHNSIIVFDGKAEPVARYDKWRLVPGGEFLPLEWLLEPLGFRKVVTVPGSFAAGPGPVTMSIPGAPDVAMLVCYEAVFPDRLIDPSHRPGFIVNVTNDGWFGRSTGPYQHLAQTRLRAIEQGIPILRAANTGISTVIDGHGRYVEKLPLLEAGVIDSGLPAVLPETPYARWGDWLMLLMVIATMGSAIICGRRWNF